MLLKSKTRIEGQIFKYIFSDKSYVIVIAKDEIGYCESTSLRIKANLLPTTI